MKNLIFIGAYKKIIKYNFLLIYLKKMSKGKTKILIVDDHPVVRQGLKLIIEEEDDFKICGDAGDIDTASRMVNDLNPDLVLVDISLEKNESGLDFVKALRKKYPSIPSLMISMHDEMLYAERAIKAGARGYVRKNAIGRNIVNAMRCVLSGELYLQKETSSMIVSKILNTAPNKSVSSVDQLTEREFEVFRLLGSGLGTRKIANKLGISVNTVETYRRKIRTKLNLTDSDDLIHFATQWYLESQR